MIVSNIDRSTMYEAVRHNFDEARLDVYALEIGVLRGENASSILSSISPKKMALLDLWSSSAICSALYSRAEKRPWLRSPASLSRYFGGDIRTQETFDTMHQGVLKKFAEDDRVTVIRGSTSDWSDHSPSGLYNFIYLDASHQYEDVLDDLIAIDSHAADRCIIQLNDCLTSSKGHSQNIGVLEAASHFLKLCDWKPLLLGAQDNDLIVARGFPDIITCFEAFFESRNLWHVRIPNGLLASGFRNDKGSISFEGFDYT